MSVPPVPAEAAELTRRIGLVDSHNDFATAIAHRRASGCYDSLASYWLPRFRSGGVALVVAPVWISSQFVPEAALRRAGCVEAVALPWPHPQQAESIVAVVSGAAEVSRLATLAGHQLPSYMVPRSIHVLDQLPLNPNGKIDRAAVRRWLDDQLAAA